MDDPLPTGHGRAHTLKVGDKFRLPVELFEGEFTHQAWEVLEVGLGRDVIWVHVRSPIVWPVAGPYVHSEMEFPHDRVLEGVPK